MKKRYYRNNSNDSFTNKFLDTLGGILGIFFLYLVLTFYVNRAQFWHIMSSFILPVVIAIVVLFSLYLYYLAQRKKRETNRFEDTVKKIKEIGFDVKFNTFIDMFGKEGKGDNFEYRGYSFRNERLSDFRDTAIKNSIEISSEDNLELIAILKYFIDEKDRRYMSEGLGSNISNKFSNLNKSGDDFENLIVRLYNVMGYSSKRIGGHGDQGGDVIANKDGESLLIQAKDYTSSVGNAAVQQAVAARLHYGCTKAIVVTQSHFTSEAIELAKSNSVELIDGDLLKQKLLEYLKERWN